MVKMRKTSYAFSTSSLSPKISQRLIPGTPAEAEWMYLTNETLEGEKCIVPQLWKIQRDPVVQENKGLRETLARQYDEEVEHVKLFNDIVGQEKVLGSGYRKNLISYVDSLPSVTLKLFALQGMLEGYALGALRHRLRSILNSPSEKIDAKALFEEIDHVAFSFEHFGYLKKAEGVHAPSAFKKVMRDVNNIFSNSFKGENIARIFNESFGIKIEDPRKIDESEAMASLQSLSKRSVIENKNQFTKKYFEEKYD